MLNDEALTAPEVAKILHIGRNSVYAMAKSGELPSYRVGRKLFFALKDVRAYLERSRSGGLPSETNAIASEPDSSMLNDGYARDSQTVLVGGIGPLASIIAERVNASGIPAIHETMTSYEALTAMYGGRVDAAVVHLYDQRTNSYNLPFIQRLIPCSPLIVFRLLSRRQGFAVARRNPKSLTTWSALLKPDVRLANQRRGCGSRVLLDEKLIALESVGQDIQGYDEELASCHLACQAVADGHADIAIADEAEVARIPDLDFVPQQTEWLDRVVSRQESRRFLTPLFRELLANDSFAQVAAGLVKGNASKMGAIIYQC